MRVPIQCSQWGRAVSTRFALLLYMTLRTRSIRQVADIVGHALTRSTAAIIGFVMMVAGVGMTATIVMLPMGIVLLLLGVAIFVAGLFAREDRPERQGDH